MIQSLSDMIVACEWSPASYLVISQNVFDPLIYYSHLFPLIGSLILGVFVFVKGRKQLAPKVLLVITVLLGIWLFSDLVVWATDKPSLTMFFWSMTIMVEPMIYAGLLYFLYLFIDQKDISFKTKIVIALLLLPTVIFTPTKFALLGYDISNCDRDAVEGILVYYGYAIEMLFICWGIILSIIRFIQKKNTIERKKIVLVSIGSLGFLLTFSFGNIIGSWFDTNSIFGDYSWSIGQYGIFGVPIFVAFLSYLIVKFKTFKIKLIASQALVVGLFIIIAAQFFYASNPISLILNGIALSCSLGFGFLLVRSVKREVAQREKIEKLARDLTKANDRLLDLDRQKSEFVSFATHQLRAPLTAMKGYTSLILEGDLGALSPEARDAVKRISDSSNTLAAVVDDYLNVSRIELGTMKYSFTSLDLRQLVESVLAELKPNIDASKEVKLSFSAAPLTPPATYMINADRDKFKQILANLIDNSLKYTPKGSVNISLERVATQGGTGTAIRFTVKDTGVGIAPAVIPKLFAKFARADNANSVNIHGTGLGLFVAKDVVLAHHGKIWAESKGEGMGSTFIVEIPAFSEV